MCNVIELTRGDNCYVLLRIKGKISSNVEELSLHRESHDDDDNYVDSWQVSILISAHANEIGDILLMLEDDDAVMMIFGVCEENESFFLLRRLFQFLGVLCKKIKIRKSIAIFVCESKIHFWAHSALKKSSSDFCLLHAKKRHSNSASGEKNYVNGKEKESRPVFRCFLSLLELWTKKKTYLWRFAIYWTASGSLTFQPNDGQTTASRFRAASRNSSGFCNR